MQPGLGNQEETSRGEQEIRLPVNAGRKSAGRPVVQSIQTSSGVGEKLHKTTISKCPSVGY